MRTVYRDIQTLTMAGIPLYFDKSSEACRVREGFRFGGIEANSATPNLVQGLLPELLSEASRLVRDGEDLVDRLRQLVNRLEEGVRGGG